MIKKVSLVAGISAIAFFSSVAAAGQWSVGASVLYHDSPYKDIKTSDKFMPVPMINYDSDDFYFHSLAAGYYLWQDDKDIISLDVFYYPQAFRAKDSKNEQMRKLDNRRDTMMGGFTYRHVEDWGTLRSIFSADMLGKSKGMNVDLAYLYSIEAQDWSVQPGVGVVWNSKKQNQYGYQISANESRRSGFEEYNPDSSFTPYLELSGNYSLTKSWNVFAMGRFDFLPSEIKDSPMVDKSYSAILWTGVTYSF